MNTELNLPCPFCGQSKLDRTISRRNAGDFMVKCGTWNCPGNNGYSQESDWNKRPALEEKEPVEDKGEAALRKAQADLEQLLSEPGGSSPGSDDSPSVAELMEWLKARPGSFWTSMNREVQRFLDSRKK